MWLLRRPDFCASTWFFPGYPTAFIGEPPFSAVSNPRFHLTHTFSPEKMRNLPISSHSHQQNQHQFFPVHPGFCEFLPPFFVEPSCAWRSTCDATALPERLAEAAAGEVSGQGPATDDALEVVGVGKCLGTKNEKSPSDIHIYIYTYNGDIHIYIYNGDIYIYIMVIYIYI